MELDFSDVQETRSCIFEERLKVAEELRVKGNEFYNSKDYFNAADCYHRALFHVDFEEMSWNFELLDQHRDAVLVIKVPLCLNAAAVKLKDNEFEAALKLADYVLKEQKDNAKAMYRKASALLMLKRYDEGITVIKRANRLSPNDAAILGLHAKFKNVMQKEHQRYKRVLRKVFTVKKKRFGLNSLLSFRNPFNLFHWIS